jgi:X-Pro dipeptidyl-peptidase
MKFIISLILFVIILMMSISFPNAQENTSKVGPVFKDDKSQIVSAFNHSEQWIRHDLWVETAFDTDGDQKLDRVHVDVTRPKQTESEGLKLPVI